MRSHETEFEMVLRHVRDGAAILARQKTLIDRLTILRLPTEKAEELLRLFQSLQSEHMSHLQRLGCEWACSRLHDQPGSVTTS